MGNSIENVISAVNSEHMEFVKQLHDKFISAKFKSKIESKASGYFVSFAHPETKKSMFNFYFRKNGLHVRLYPPRNAGLVTLTDYMVSEVDKQPDCKLLTGTAACSPYCVKGYEFELNGKNYQKCRMSAFSFLVTTESKPVIVKWVDGEILK